MSANGMTRKLRAILDSMSKREFRVKIVNVRIKDDWEPKISMHALLRFIERVEGVDVQAIRDRLNSPAIRTAIAYGATSVKCSDYTTIIEGRTIVTVLGKQMRPKKDKQQLRVVS